MRRVLRLMRCMHQKLRIKSHDPRFFAFMYHIRDRPKNACLVVFSRTKVLFQQISGQKKRGHWRILLYPDQNGGSVKLQVCQTSSISSSRTAATTAPGAETQWNTDMKAFQTQSAYPKPNPVRDTLLLLFSPAKSTQKMTPRKVCIF